MPPVVSATRPLHLATFNVNNLRSKKANAKRHAVAHVLEVARPHIAILCETAQRPGEAFPSLRDHSRPWNPAAEYNTYATPAVVNISTGVAVLVSSTVAATKVDFAGSTASSGRLCVVDVRLPDEFRRQKVVRVIGAYCPYTIEGPLGKDGQLTPFYQDLMRVISDGPDDWIVGGDINASLLPEESHTTSQSSQPARQAAAFRGFLNASRGIDVWSSRSDLSWERDWTMVAHSECSTRRIMDRFVVSPGLVAAVIETYSGDGVIEPLTRRVDPEEVRSTLSQRPAMPVPLTNHRPVSVKIRLGCLVPDSRVTSKNQIRPRLRRPKRADEQKAFATLNEVLNQPSPSLPTPEQPPTTLGEAEALYRWCDERYTAACKKAFRRPARTGVVNAYFSDPKESAECDKLRKRLTLVNRCIGCLRQGCLTRRTEADDSLKGLTEDLGITRDTEFESSLQTLRSERLQLEREIRKMHRRSNSVKAKAMEQAEWQKAIGGGAVKHLFQDRHIDYAPYLLVKDSAEAEPILVSDPREKLREWHRHFESVLSITPPAPAPKPWMNSVGAEEVKRRTAGAKAFLWPRRMTVAELKQLLRRGNQRPSPGPDGWERWPLAHCDDTFLEKITWLVNFVVHTNQFPAALRNCYLSPLHKRNDIVEPSNYRPIILSNALFNLISRWFSEALHQYVWKNELLSPTQIGAQAGVHPGDLVQLLQGVNSCTLVQQETLYGLKRDHKQGFDRLHASAFEDALTFFGFGEEVLAFERARTAQARIRVRTHDGVGEEVIVTDGQTKQGDPMSSLKYCMTTSMLYWWWTCDAEFERLLPTVSTYHSSHRTPHTPLDDLRQVIAILEATDDSWLLARSWEDLGKLVASAERFQSAYGMATHWDDARKTMAFTLGLPPSDPQSSVSFILDPSPNTAGNAVTVRVPVAQSAVILNTVLNDSQATFERILDVIDVFPLSPLQKLPLAVIRRVVYAVLLPQIRSRLAMQPLPMHLAEEVDKAVARKISAAMSVPFRNTSALCLPVDHLGFGFPSFFRVNGEVAVTMILRMLNHPLPPFKRVAQMLLANWGCMENGCVSPLDDGLQEIKQYTKWAREEPKSWFTKTALKQRQSKVVPAA